KPGAVLPNNVRKTPLVPGLFPGDVRDVRARNADIGEFTVAQLGKFLHRDPIALPVLKAPDKGGEHGRFPFSGTKPPESLVEYKGLCCVAKYNGAAQLGEICICNVMFCLPIYLVARLRPQSPSQWLLPMPPAKGPRAVSFLLIF